MNKVGWGSGQPVLVPDLVVGGLPVAGVLELHDPWGPLQLQPFCDSVMHKPFNPTDSASYGYKFFRR